MDIVNEKIGIKDILSGLADLVFIKDTFSKKEKTRSSKKEWYGNTTDCLDPICI